MHNGKKIYVILAFGAASVCSTAAAKEMITLRADTWCPYNCDPTSKTPGYVIEIAKEVFAKVGIDVEYKTLNWARAISDSRKGDYVGIVGATHSDAPDFVFPEETEGPNQNCFYTAPKSQWRYAGVSSLEKVKLGIIRDYAYSDEVDSYIKEHVKNSKSIEVVSGDNPLEMNLKKLAAGRIDATIENRFVMAYFQDSHKQIAIREAGCVKDAPIYIAFSPANKKAKRYAAELSAGLKELRKSGRLNVILARYGLKDWQAPHR